MRFAISFKNAKKNCNVVLINTGRSVTKKSIEQLNNSSLVAKTECLEEFGYSFPTRKDELKEHSWRNELKAHPWGKLLS